MREILDNPSTTGAGIEKDSFYIIGIGSSAGGLKALGEFFDNCPSDTGFAFVIIQHLSPDYKSLMPELLSRHSQMSVKEAKEGDTVTPNHVYLIPGEKNLQIKNGKLELTKRPPSNQINFSIDIFFNSLAIEQRERALAIILSGTGSDGTKGAKAIKEIGGTVFAQSLDSADFDGMPRSVIHQGLADYVLEPKEMGRELVDFVSHNKHVLPIPLEKEITNDESLVRILKIIKKHVGYDFFSYKKPTLLRRTAKRISITKSQTVENYIDYLHDHPNEKLLLTQEFLIGVTKFFRDSAAFEILKKDVIPAIVRGKGKGETIKIWIVACSSGEEAYSITILLEQYLRLTKTKIKYKVFATDLDDRGIEVATKGIYNESIEAEVPPDILSDYFVKKEDKYQIKPSIRKNIIFSKHDVLQNPPFNKMDLVSCRNMLIYMENDIQHKVLSSLHYALNLNGYLFLGNSENLGLLDKNFDEVSSKWKIYKNIQPERIVNTKKGDVWRVDRGVQSKYQTSHRGSNIEDKIAKSINKLLMDAMSAVSICIDENFEIIHASGKLKKYIIYPEDGYSNNLLKILPDDLNVPLAIAIRKVSLNPEQTVEKRLKLVLADKLINIRLLVRYFNIVSPTSRSFLITIVEEFERDLNDEDGLEIAAAAGSNIEQVHELQQALDETRESLQTTIEELETSNEEMQATNEELLASNEELQSTNEELQSLNEELHTVNAELQEKNQQLVELNSDVENLIKNINTGTIFLDKAFRIRKYTPAITEHFQLRIEDIGRPIDHFSGTLGGADLVKYSQEVTKTLQPFTKEVKSLSGCWFKMQIFPYRSQEDSIQGVVINFIDIHESKKAIQETEKLNGFLSHIMEYNPAVLYLYDVIKQENIYSSSNIAEIAGYTKEEIKLMGAGFLEKIVHEDDYQSILAHHEKIKNQKDDAVNQIEYRIIHKKTKEPIWLLSSDKINKRNKKGEVETILGIVQEISHLKKMEAKLKRSEERFRLAINATRSGLWEWSNLLTDDIWCSEDFCNLLGYSEMQMNTSFSGFLRLIHPDHKLSFRKKLESHIKKGGAFEKEVLIKTNEKGYRWFRVNGRVQYSDKNATIQKIVGTLLDIHHRKDSERKMQELNVELERFAYLASHDLKEPLRTVTSFTQLFKEEYSDRLDENAFTYLNFIEKASSRMITLTNDLLVYSQLDNKSLNFEKVDVTNVISNIKDDLLKIINENEAEIKVDKMPKITCDATQIKQLFQNLISNSIKYRSSKNPLIEIKYREINNSHEFVVKDNGIGIPKKHFVKIFEVFKRLHSQSEYEGTGIGLANCKRIVDNHKGEIFVKSKENEGSEFFVLIPKL